MFKVSWAIAICMASTFSARADFISLTYEQVSESLTGLLDRVAVARDLSHDEARVAKQISGAWVAAGPCKMPHIPEAEGALPILLNPIPEIRYHAAVLEMVAILTADNLGRGPTENVCRFASELAKT